MSKSLFFTNQYLEVKQKALHDMQLKKVIAEKKNRNNNQLDNSKRKGEREH